MNETCKTWEKMQNFFKMRRKRPQISLGNYDDEITFVQTKTILQSKHLQDCNWGQFQYRTKTPVCLLRGNISNQTTAE